MKYWTQIASAFAALAIAGAAYAQNYPSHEIKMIVPFPAGGPSDIVVEPNIVRAMPGRDMAPRPAVGEQPPRIAPLPDAAWSDDGNCATSAHASTSGRFGNHGARKSSCRGPFSTASRTR